MRKTTITAAMALVAMAAMAEDKTVAVGIIGRNGKKVRAWTAKSHALIKLYEFVKWLFAYESKV